MRRVATRSSASLRHGRCPPSSPSSPTTGSRTSSSACATASSRGWRPDVRVIDLTHGIAAPRRRAAGARAAPRAAVHAARACTSRSSTRASAAAAGRRAALRGATGCSSVPTTGCSSPAAERLGGVDGGGRPRDVAVACWSRCRRRSTGATSSPRSPAHLAAGAPLAEAGARARSRRRSCALDAARAAHATARRSSRTRSRSTPSATSCSTPAGGDLAREPSASGRGSLGVRASGRTFGDVARRRAAALRGLLRRARARRQPGLRARRAGAAARRRRPHRMTRWARPARCTCAESAPRATARAATLARARARRTGRS